MWKLKDLIYYITYNVKTERGGNGYSIIYITYI